MIETERSSLNIPFPHIPSDALAPLRKIIGNLPNIAEHFQGLQQIRVVIDSNVILADLIFLAKRRRDPSTRSSLKEVLVSETLIAFAPTELKNEIEEKIPIIAEEKGLHAPDLMTEWQTYEKHIHFCQGESIPTEGVVRDPDDLPFIYLCARLGAAGILTHDKDIPAMGGPALSLDIVYSLRDFSRAKSVEVSFQVGGMFACRITGEAMSKIAAGLVRVVTQIPAPLKVLIALVCIGAFLHPKSRASIIDTSMKLWGRLEPYITVFAEKVVLLAQTFEERKRIAEVEWQVIESLLPKRKRPTLKQLAYAACIEFGRPVALREIMAKTESYGYKSRTKDYSRYLRHVVSKDSLFLRCPDGLWIAA